MMLVSVKCSLNRFYNQLSFSPRVGLSRNGFQLDPDIYINSHLHMFEENVKLRLNCVV